MRNKEHIALCSEGYFTEYVRSVWYLEFLDKTFDLTGKSLSVALIFASTNPQYDDRLFIELQFQCSNLGRTYILCSECQKQFLYTTCSPHVLQKLTKIYLYDVFF